MARSDRPTSATPEQIEQLTSTIERLADEVHVLRTVLDDVRGELSWALSNLQSPDVYRPVMHVTSMPIDPCCKDFGERLNRLSAKDLPAEESPPAKKEVMTASENPVPSRSPPSPDSAALPSAEPPVGSPTSPKESLPAKRPRRLPGKKKSPLYDRIFYKPHYVELVQFIGSEGRPLPEVQEMLKVLEAKFSQETLKEAADEILDIDTSRDPPIVRLTDEARKLAGSILAQAAQVNPASALKEESSGERHSLSTAQHDRART